MITIHADTPQRTIKQQAAGQPRAGGAGCLE
jgi:hypothetical protein